MVDEQPTPMKPQDTVIFLLGELKGQVGSLTSSVTASAASQAEVNAANETEHAKFRQAIATHDTDLAVLKGEKRFQQESKLTRIQLIGLWVGAPSGLLAVIGLLAYINFNH